ncbi:MAG TPA: hypothetical protein VNK23_07170 [Candidatus Dormibacteraeota bacterium]|nr:hypothetical protein [Candidatus Dormibacteraeota bacterium]
MNKILRSFSLECVFALAVALGVPGIALAQNHPAGMHPPQRPMPIMPMGRTLTTPPRPVVSPSKGIVKNASGEQFFIVASIDQQNNQLLLKRPTEVTVLVKIDAKTKYFNDEGKPIPISSFRAGDTVWAKVTDSATDPSVIEMREGEMTLADLHKYYLDYPIIK